MEIKEEVADLGAFNPTKKKKKKKVVLNDLANDSVDQLAEKTESLSVTDGMEPTFTGLKKKKKQVDTEPLDEDKEDNAEDANDSTSQEEEGEGIVLEDKLPWEVTDRDYQYEELLGRVFHVLREHNPELAGDRRRKVMRTPQVLREGTKKTVFANYMELCKSFGCEKAAESKIDIESRICNKQVPVELIHLIQSLLPLKEGGRTCILSKSWLHAWYTLPTIKLMHPDRDKTCTTHDIETSFNKLAHNTLQRYEISDTPIQSFHLLTSIFYKNTLEDVQNWIRLVVSKSRLQELLIEIMFLPDNNDLSLPLPNELFFSQALEKIHLKAPLPHTYTTDLHLQICSTNVINCVSLRILALDSVFINQETFNKLLSTCMLLEKIKLHLCGGLNNVMVKNLLSLTELDIHSEEDDTWEIINVPSLCSFRYRQLSASKKPMPFHLDSLESVTELCIAGDLTFDLPFFETLQIKFSMLKKLTLLIHCCELTTLVFISASLQCLTLTIFPTGPAVDIQVYAPSLDVFMYTGKIPGLHFGTTPPKQVKLTFSSWESLNHLCFLKMREALDASSEFAICIEENIVDSLVKLNDIDVDDLRTRVLKPPVMNVELKIETSLEEHVWEQSRFFDAFFLICHPSYIKCPYPVIRKMVETADQLKQVCVKNPYNGNWEVLTSRNSVLDKFDGHLDCKLLWVSQ